jgi:hypothetical protein
MSNIGFLVCFGVSDSLVCPTRLSPTLIRITQIIQPQGYGNENGWGRQNILLADTISDLTDSGI